MVNTLILLLNVLILPSTFHYAFNNFSISEDLLFKKPGHTAIDQLNISIAKDTIPRKEAIRKVHYGTPYVAENEVIVRKDTVVIFYPETYEEIFKITKNEIGLLIDTDTLWFKDVKQSNEVQQLPQFPGGTIAQAEFVKSHLQYPTDARQSKNTESAVISFVVTRDGNMVYLKINHDPGHCLGAEALRVAHLMAQQFTWTPGILEGKKVSVEMTLPILFN